MSNIKDVPASKRGFTLAFMERWKYGRTVTKTNVSLTDRLPYFLIKGAPRAPKSSAKKINILINLGLRLLLSFIRPIHEKR